jgi:protoporphyrinogen oxidase
MFQHAFITITVALMLVSRTLTSPVQAFVPSLTSSFRPEPTALSPSTASTISVPQQQQPQCEVLLYRWNALQPSRSALQAKFLRRIFGRGRDKDRTKLNTRDAQSEIVDLCIVGGGISGLTAALTAAERLAAQNGTRKIVLMEATPTLGGRVQSDTTVDGYTFDRGFAVFIEEYPTAKKIFDYKALKLGKFLPGALVKVPDANELARVTDPLREPSEIFTALVAPVGSIFDKLSLLPLISQVRASTIDQLFTEDETDTLEELMVRWGFSSVIVERFFKPFLEGIYLAPLEEQSSRMFKFVFKMFSEGSASLPTGGMQMVANQLVTKVKATGIVDIRTSQPISQIVQPKEQEMGYTIITTDAKTKILASSVIIATEGNVAQKLLASLDGFEFLQKLPEQPQREVGCLYYTFEGEPPVADPILILNGMGSEFRGTVEDPVNNICFPSAVSDGYAPSGSSVCSVTVLKRALEFYEGKDAELDRAVRKQLSSWFPSVATDIATKWTLRKIYRIPVAQPSQLYGPAPASVHGGRVCSQFRGKKLPHGLFVCGDHMATATLNGALESGENAGNAASKHLLAT